VDGDIIVKNTRENSEDIGLHRDRLAREKNTNQHALYAQQVAMRQNTLNGINTLYDKKTAMRQGTMAGIEHSHSLKQELLRYRVAQELGNAEAIVSHKNKAIVELMNIKNARLQGRQGQHADNMQLMKYQLDERNKLLVGLYGFVERREDIGPRFEELTKLTTALGDAGGGWLTP